MIHRNCSEETIAALLGIAVVLGACRAPQPFGDRNSLIVRGESGLLAEVDSVMMAALERRIFTTRPERTFRVTFVASTDTLWNKFRLWQQVILLGSSEDQDIKRVAGSANAAQLEAPALFQARDVWARGQTVTVLLLPREDQARALESLLPDLYSLLDGQYEAWVRRRMYASGVNDTLSEILSDFGFTLELPTVYAFGREDSVFRFRNVYPNPATLLRSITVVSRTGVQEVEAESLRSWRVSFGESYYDPPQDVEDLGIRFDTVEVAGAAAPQLRGVWHDLSDYPAAGPFIVRAVTCPQHDRTYYIDAWLYAPGKDKYPYVRQLEILLGSFRCAAAG